MRDTHPAEHVLREYLDGELDWPRATTCALHLRRCAACRAALEELRDLDLRASALLSRVSDAVPAARARRPRHLRWRLGLGAFAAALLLLYLSPARPAGGGGSGTNDVCCFDLDGGGRGDDGVFTRSGDGEVVKCVILYDDVDRSRSLTLADVIRSVTGGDACRTGAGAMPPSAARPPR